MAKRLSKLEKHLINSKSPLINNNDNNELTIDNIPEYSLKEQHNHQSAVLKYGIRIYVYPYYEYGYKFQIHIEHEDGNITKRPKVYINKTEDKMYAEIAKLYTFYYLYYKL